MSDVGKITIIAKNIKGNANGQVRYDAKKISNTSGGVFTQNGKGSGVSHNNNTQPKQAVGIKITKLEGPFDEAGKLVKNVKVGEFYTFKATPSRKPIDVEIPALKWALKPDDKEQYQVNGAGIYNRLIDGKIVIKLRMPAMEEKVKVYAFYNKPSESVKVEVELFVSLIKIVITSEITGYTIQSLKGEDYLFSDPVVVVPTYKAKILNITNSKKEGIEEGTFDLTRDAWYNLGKNKNGEYKLLNRAFVPANWKQNLYGVFWIPSYPNVARYLKSGMDAFVFTRFGKRKIPAKPLETQKTVDGKHIDSPRPDENFATDVMIHVGGTYELKGYDHVGGSYGCFGFIPKDDIYSTPELAKKASKNDDYDDKTSNSDWKKIANMIIKLSFENNKKLQILLEERDESQNYYPKEVLSE